MEYHMKSCFSNAALIPLYQGHEEMNSSNVHTYVNKQENGYRFVPPEWVDDLIFMQANICKVTEEGTFAAAIPVLDHMVRTGANALWVTPFFENSGNVNRTSHYGNQGPQTLASDSFRAKTHDEREKELQEFVRQAHARNIYVFADVVTYGVLESSPIYQAYVNRTLFDGIDVSEWFTGEKLYSGYRFRWESATLRAWFADRMTELITKYDLDGFRVDSEPTYLFYDSDGDGVVDTYADIYTEVRLRVAGYEKNQKGEFFYPPDAKGRKISVFSEKNNLRNYGYDFEQFGVIHYGEEQILGFQLCNGKHHNWFRETDLATSVRNGTIADGRWFTDRLKVPVGTPNAFKHYTYCVSNHDYHSTAVNRNLWVAGYQALLAPFIPVWYYGEESGLISRDNIWLNAVRVDTEFLLQDPDNARFYQQFCRLVAFRRQYPELFGITSEDIRDSNVASVVTSAGVLGYLRYTADDVAVVLASPDGEQLDCHVSFSMKEFTTDAKCEALTDLLTGTVYSAESDGDWVHINGIQIPEGGMAVLLTGIKK